MSEPIDRLALDMATDLLKEHGFDQLADVLRKACRPTVPDVLPLAIAYLRDWPNGLPGLFSLGEVSDDELRADRDRLGTRDDEQTAEFVRLLLEMSPSQRRKLARRAIREVEHERCRPTVTARVLAPGEVSDPDAPGYTATVPWMGGPLPAGTVVGRNPDGPYTTPDVVVRVHAGPWVPRFGATITAEGQEMTVVETGEDPRDGGYLVARAANGVHRRFSGLALYDLLEIDMTTDLPLANDDLPTMPDPPTPEPPYPHAFPP